MIDARRLTVGRLKELLKDVPDGLFVETEGCDCIGPSDGIRIDGPTLIINRNEEIEREEDVEWRTQIKQRNQTTGE